MLDLMQKIFFFKNKSKITAEKKGKLFETLMTTHMTRKHLIKEFNWLKRYKKGIKNIFLSLT